jgi:uncharacterized membrane protein
MEKLFEQIAGHIALALEGVAVLIILMGALLVLFQPPSFIRGRGPIGTRKLIWRNFGMWLLLALEFELGADIVRTAHFADLGGPWPTNYFLERDVEKYEPHVEAAAAEAT